MFEVPDHAVQNLHPLCTLRYSATHKNLYNLVHRLDNNNANGTWLNLAMSDDGTTGGDETASDGIYSATLTQYQSDNALVQFYVEASGAGGVSTTQPKLGPTELLSQDLTTATL